MRHIGKSLALARIGFWASCRFTPAQASARLLALCAAGSASPGARAQSGAHAKRWRARGGSRASTEGTLLGGSCHYRCTDAESAVPMHSGTSYSLSASCWRELPQSQQQ